MAALPHQWQRISVAQRHFCRRYPPSTSRLGAREQQLHRKSQLPLRSGKYYATLSPLRSLRQSGDLRQPPIFQQVEREIWDVITSRRLSSIIFFGKKRFPFFVVRDDCTDTILFKFRLSCAISRTNFVPSVLPCAAIAVAREFRVIRGLLSIGS